MQDLDKTNKKFFFEQWTICLSSCFLSCGTTSILQLDLCGQSCALMTEGIPSLVVKARHLGGFAFGMVHIGMCV